MTDVFLERDFDPPFTPDGVNRLMDKYGWCFDLYKVDWQLSCLSTDGAHMLCWFKSPDAEAARNAVRQFGGDVRKLWIGAVHEARDADAHVANVAVERAFSEPVAVADLQAQADAHAWCLDAHQVRFVRTFAANDGKRMVCLYAAPDAESVRLAQRLAGMPVTAVWAFRHVDRGVK